MSTCSRWCLLHPNPQIAYIGTHGSGVYRSKNGGLSWQPAGLGGQTILSLAVDPADPNLVYAATEISGSLWVSIDGGNSWNNIFLPVNFYSVLQLPQRNQVLCMRGRAVAFTVTNLATGQLWGCPTSRSQSLQLTQ